MSECTSSRPVLSFILGNVKLWCFFCSFSFGLVLWPVLREEEEEREFCVFVSPSHEIIHDLTKKDDFHNLFLLYQKGPLMVISLGIPASVTQ